MSDPAGATDDLVLSNPAQGVLQIQLNRPERRNALATPLLQRLAAALEQADRDSDVRVVILCGHAKVFAAGADIGELAASTPDDPVESPRFKAWAAMRRFSKPLLAAVEGWCLGAGLELGQLLDGEDVFEVEDDAGAAGFRCFSVVDSHGQCLRHAWIKPASCGFVKFIFALCKNQAIIPI